MRPVAPARNTVDDFFTRADVNHDGVLTRAEFQDAAIIARQDRNSAAGR